MCISRIKSIFSQVGEGKLDASVSALHEYFESCDASTRTTASLDIVKALDERNGLSDEDTRIMVLKFAIALLPDTLSVVRDCITQSTSKVDKECQFTLFCFLDEIQPLPLDVSIKDGVLIEIRDYLINVSTETASAAWMAGDLLGHHWMTTEAMPILIDVLQTARFVAGRLAALHGLEMMLTECNEEIRDRIGVCLRNVVETDRSEIVRIMTDRLLEKIS